MQPEAKIELRTSMRWLIRRDMPEVLAIENASFAAPWTHERLVKSLQQRDCIGMVAEYGDRIVSYMVYKLNKKDLVITNFAVDPEYRKTGLGRMMMKKMVENISKQRRERIVILLPDECAGTRAFFMKCGRGITRIRTTDTKGLASLEIVLKRMKSKHVVGVQMIEDECIEGNGRNIGRMLGHGTRGMIAVNTRGIEGDNIVGYVLWEEDARSPCAPIVVNGAIGQITHPDYLHRGVGRALMRYVASLGKPLVVSDIDLKDRDRCAFLRDIGVPVPELSRYVTVEWKPEPTA